MLKGTENAGEQHWMKQIRLKYRICKGQRRLLRWETHNWRENREKLGVSETLRLVSRVGVRLTLHSHNTSVLLLHVE